MKKLKKLVSHLKHIMSLGGAYVTGGEQLANWYLNNR